MREIYTVYNIIAETVSYYTEISVIIPIKLQGLCTSCHLVPVLGY